MKTIHITILLLATSLMSFSQVAFTEKTFNDMMGRYQKETVEFLKTETTPDFIFLGVGGEPKNREAFITFVQGSDAFLTNDFSNLKIRQYGNTAILTGLWNHSHRLKHDNNVVSYKESVTETFINQNGKWLFASHQGGLAPMIKAEEEAAIKSVIEKETTTWNARDTEGFVSCWANVPYAVQLVAHGVAQSNSGVAFSTNEKKNLPELVKGMFAGMGKPDGSTFKSDNYVIRVNGNSAFVHYDQTNTATDNKTNTYHEVRYLEKVNSDWKIVYVGAVKYPLIEK
jgi:ketosteroid isomerase-like protein